MSTRESLIVYGYIRRIDKLLQKCKQKYIIPTGVINICSEYYLSIIQFFVATSSHIIKVDVDAQQIQYVSDLNGNCSSAGCYIPELQTSHLPLLHNKIKNNTSYQGLFTYKAATDGYHSLNLIQNYNDSNNEIIAFTSPTESDDVPLDKISIFGGNKSIWSDRYDYIYCGDNNGIIAATEDGIYQLKLENINEDKFDFVKLNDEWKVDSTYLVPRYLTLCDIPKQNKVFAVETCQYVLKYIGINDKCINKQMQSAKCGIFDFETTKWEYVDNYKCNPYRSDDSLWCGLCYDEYKDYIYLVSSKEKLSRYDFHKNKWQYISGLNNKIGQGDKQIFDGKPIVWLDGKHSNIIYYAAISDALKIEIKRCDLRDNATTKWMRCYEELTNLLAMKLSELGAGHWSVGLIN